MAPPSREIIMGRCRKNYGFSFSWRRALGVSAAKGRISRQIGIPLTRSGRQRELARALGCVIPLAIFVAALGSLLLDASAFARLH